VHPETHRAYAPEQKENGRPLANIVYQAVTAPQSAIHNVTFCFAGDAA
jgi:hypothetical protein